ncbi:MAG: hypothetical protein Ct9H300mP16_15090 [Pseudomonadota bacterium]|nr:MAG: hypothetical protein Ct9H300mP16_15090 [Pseudomonadota bacterium]
MVGTVEALFERTHDASVRATPGGQDQKPAIWSPVTVSRYINRVYFSSSKGVGACKVQRLSHRTRSPGRQS